MQPQSVEVLDLLEEVRRGVDIRPAARASMRRHALEWRACCKAAAAAHSCGEAHSWLDWAVMYLESALLLREWSKRKCLPLVLGDMSKGGAA